MCSELRFLKEIDSCPFYSGSVRNLFLSIGLIVSMMCLSNGRMILGQETCSVPREKAKGDISLIRDFIEQPKAKDFSIAYKEQTVRRQGLAESEVAELPIVEMKLAKLAFSAAGHRYEVQSLLRDPRRLSQITEKVERGESYLGWESPMDIVVHSVRYPEDQEPKFLSSFFNTAEIESMKSLAGFDNTLRLRKPSKTPNINLKLIVDKAHIAGIVSRLLEDPNASVERVVMNERDLLEITSKVAEEDTTVRVWPEFGFSVLYLKREITQPFVMTDIFEVTEIGSNGLTFTTVRQTIRKTNDETSISKIMSTFSEVKTGDEAVGECTLNLKDTLADGVKVQVQGASQIAYIWQQGCVRKKINNKVLDRLKEAKLTDVDK